jgi:hypothetical protein
MVVERVNQPKASGGDPSTGAERTRVILRFAAIEAVGAAALVAFLVGFFVMDWFPGQPGGLLAAALAAFALYVVFAMWASGLLAMIMTDKNNAGR